MPHGPLVYRAYEDSPFTENKWRYDVHADGTVLRYERIDDRWWFPEPVPWAGY